MNQYAKLGLVLLMAGVAFQAQAQTKALPARRGAVAPKARIATAPGATMKDGFLMKDGKVMATRNAQTSAVGREEALVNGTKVQPDGTVMMADGTTVRLAEGDYMSLTGRLTTRAWQAEQDSLQQLKMMKAKGKKKK
ncbi:hypothetical protein CDA63_02220 [Hymenobacter amundsenii]|uniref:DUF6799 domain-containing protein n=1 Tax=Hymenobacter amundsenii TaxID=2006685 RepID=A0A246FPA9_9BACT|nr:DUF6799 domain-containing protein [Hymenobacter amundsenii]OWP64595.1 hypothetical protein CDA63_02220 [Hymenobacter amundsenii]